MSTERPDNDVTGPRRRRPRLAVASVAAAVLLAGGGGAYWASTASDEGGRADGGAAAKDEARPLTLDAPADLRGVASSASDTPPPGIAPGEPDPSGPPVVYRASGDLPDGPDEAAVHVAKGTVAPADVARLAKALGIPGTPHTRGTSWVVGDEDGPGALLKVAKQAPGTWTFAATTPSEPCEPGMMCANGPTGPGGGEPVSEKAAKAAAAPVLKAAGQDDAALNAGQVMGDVRVVNADPKIDGLPTYGWSTGVQVGPDGRVTGGSGHLKALEKGDTYPTVGADEALKQLNAENRGKGDGGRDVGGCATPVPLEGEPKPPSELRCVPSNGKRAPVERTVEAAAFGLALNHVEGRPTLVPSWLFTVRQAPGGPEDTVTRIAVDPEFIERPRTPTPSGDRKVTSYGADGRTLEVTFWGGVCSTYTASAQESAGQVRITVTEKPQEDKKACIMIAKELTRTVTLDKPLGDRTVIDAASGGAVPRG
ncbi:hypothetical protein [Streptomyces sp. V2I9]|uniref:hypothetical protein n=1 Tax=Streptomyces sp. V2I9 TaxID=3042304 RepID=UPI00278197A4|nr:hypothetical protein [Streptomyces sp. V2I9]MDQ0984047.1 hypothetical protein [Streptomyces sp. V2I9]